MRKILAIFIVLLVVSCASVRFQPTVGTWYFCITESVDRYQLPLDFNTVWGYSEFRRNDGTIDTVYHKLVSFDKKTYVNVTARRYQDTLFVFTYDKVSAEYK